MAEGSTIHLKIITPNGIFFDGEVGIVTVKTTEGYLGIMRNTETMVAALHISPLYINYKNRPGAREAAISGGLIYCQKDQVRIITDAVEYREDIEIARAKHALQAAEEALKRQHDKQEILKFESALKRAMNRLSVAKET